MTITVETASGTLAGTRHAGILSFLGVPYAAPPVGDARFRPPQPPAPWTGVRDATRFGPVAPQNVTLMHQAFGGTPPPMDERECLTLNVWTPALDGAPRPVMVWIHGGAFVLGDGRTPWYDGANLARRDVVVVTLNYRLGALGYLALDGVDEASAGSGNAGLLDQSAALDWVHTNIAAFGGDPANVTIFGESAGAMSVSTLLGLPAARGRFHRAIAQSGAAAHVHDREAAARVTHEFLAEAGIDPPRAGAALRELPVERVLEIQAAVVARHWGSSGVSLPFQPVVDHVVLHRTPLEAVHLGEADEVALMAGATAEEMKLFTLLDPSLQGLDDAAIAAKAEGVLPADANIDAVLAAYRDRLGDPPITDLWGAVLTDVVFRAPALDLLDAHARHQPATYLYEFAYATPAFGGLLGSCHALDLPFTFDNLDAPGAAMFVGEIDDGMRSLATTMADLWTAFARTGKPEAAGAPAWSPYEPEQRHGLVLDVEPRAVTDAWAHVRHIWSDRT